MTRRTVYLLARLFFWMGLVYFLLNVFGLVVTAVTGRGSDLRWGPWSQWAVPLAAFINGAGWMAAFQICVERRQDKDRLS